jgi:hypothetical protein
MMTNIGFIRYGDNFIEGHTPTENDYETQKGQHRVEWLTNRYQKLFNHFWNKINISFRVSESSCSVCKIYNKNTEFSMLIVMIMMMTAIMKMITITTDMWIFAGFIWNRSKISRTTSIEVKDEALRQESVWGSGWEDPLLLDPGTSWR